MGFPGIVQVEDGRDRTGKGLLVHADGSVDVNVKNDPVDTIVHAGTVDVFAFAASTSSQQLVAQGQRYGLMVRNLDPTNTVFVSFGASATVADGFPVPPGGQLVLPANVVSDLEVTVVGAAGGEDVRVMVFR
jgi:hypothetical protein